MRLKAFIFFIALCTTTLVSGQLKYAPIQKKSVEKSTTKARTENTAISLPFWDDFSFTTNNYPLDSLWQDSRGVYVGNGFAIDPPSIGVASLDGINASGGRYDGGQTAKTDSLKSCPIKLGALTVANNVYISFYYQFAGTGDAPEATDSLTLEFKNNLGQWVTVWPSTSPIDRSGNFVQQLIKVDDASFFHDDFQFKFQSFGYPQGVYDLWNIDYVYMNKGRSLTDDNYPDRTIGSPLTSIFNDYTAIPAKHYTSAFNKIPSFVVASVDNPADVEQPYNTFFKVSYESWLNGTSNQISLPEKLNNFNLEIKAPNRNVEILDSLFYSLNIPENQDSIFININTLIKASDTTRLIPINPNVDTLEYRNKYIPIDFRHNDTIQSVFILKDYYAYDDGTAEASVGFENPGNRLAIEFPIPENIKDTLVAVDMYFPLSINDPAGRFIEITVWDVSHKDDSLSSIEPGKVLYKETVSILRDTLQNKFIRYKLGIPLPLADTFFLGYRQTDVGDLFVGYDVNTDSRSKFFINVDTEWKQKTSDELRGSFMIRPVFGKPDTTDLVTSVDQRELKFKVYPNPNNGIFYAEGDYQSYALYNVQGILIGQGKHDGTDRQLISLADRPKGLYIIRLKANKTIKTFKLIKE
ncbi:MAG TPA: T9SS type A sorting domain-containing protein [Fulvivirga sp.]|nr:T9SS type A sorting domain-containing protein [Fulvivirga sp.]